MAAAVPVVSAVVGTASAVSGIAAQNKQARQQQEALEAQIANSETNTALRLIEIERQKIFAQAQNQINEMSRQNASAVRQAQDAIQEANMNLQAQQNLQNADAATFLNNQQSNTQQAQLNQQGFANQAQNQLAGMQADVGLRMQQNQANAQFGLAQQAAGNDFTNQMSQIQQQQAQGLLNVQQGQNQAILGANQQQLQADQQAAQVLDQLATEFENASRQQTNQLRQQAITQAQLRSQTGSLNSLSDQAFMGNAEGELQLDAMARAAQGSSTIANLNNNLELQDALRRYSINQANRQANTARQNIPLQSQLQRLSLLQQLDDRSTQANIQRDLSLQSASVQNALAKRGIDVNRLSQQQAQQLQQQLLTNQQLQQQMLIDMDRLENSYEDNITANTFGMVQQAGKASEALQKEMESLNSQFSEIALNSSAGAAQLAGNAELAALRAQQANVNKPGFLNTLGTLTQGASAITASLPNTAKGNATPSNPFYVPPQQSQPSLMRGNPFTDANNYEISNVSLFK